MPQERRVRVMILDDHQSIIDGYLFRLGQVPQIEVVDTLSLGEELEPSLKKNPVDVLLLDVNVPTAADNPNPYPILHTIPKLLQIYPDLNVLVISMFAERTLINAVMEAGASGYILKDDPEAIRDLGSVILSIASGGIFLSHKARDAFLKYQGSDGTEAVTPRQMQALSLCAAYPNSTTAELARKMTISNSTARNLLSGAYLKLGVRTRAAAIARARQLGLITADIPTVPTRQRR